jgi:hypothetical protein
LAETDEEPTSGDDLYEQAHKDAMARAAHHEKRIPSVRSATKTSGAGVALPK